MPKFKVVKVSEVQKCPDFSFDVTHYRSDGTCLHNAPTARAGFAEPEEEPKEGEWRMVGMIVADDLAETHTRMWEGFGD
jgi:hypothetical protein